MNKNSVLMLAAGFAVSLTACNNSSETAAGTDSVGTATTMTTSGNYAARADTVKANVAAGYYINPKTSKPYKNLTVNPTTGELTDDEGQIVQRYIDNRTWWVYDANSWDTVGSARMSNSGIEYATPEGTWVDYDHRWMNDMSTDTTIKMGDDAKIKVTDKEIKIKDGDEKTKLKKDELKVKSGDEKTKSE